MDGPTFSARSINLRTQIPREKKFEMETDGKNNGFFRGIRYESVIVRKKWTRVKQSLFFCIFFHERFS